MSLLVANPQKRRIPMALGFDRNPGFASLHRAKFDQLSLGFRVLCNSKKHMAALRTFRRFWLRQDSMAFRTKNDIRYFALLVPLG